MKKSRFSGWQIAYALRQLYRLRGRGRRGVEMVRAILRRETEPVIAQSGAPSIVRAITIRDGAGTVHWWCEPDKKPDADAVGSRSRRAGDQPRIEQQGDDDIWCERHDAEL